MEISNLLTFKCMKYITYKNTCYDIIFKQFIDASTVESKNKESINEMYKNDLRKDQDVIRQYLNDFDSLCKNLGYENTKIYNYRLPHLAKQILHDALDPRAKQQQELDDFETTHCIFQNDTFMCLDNVITNENTTTYDMNSCFCYGLQASTLEFNINCGKKQMIDEFPKNLYTNAYFYCKIDLDNCPINYKKCKTNLLWVTNYDVLSFKLYGFKIELIKSCEYNSYIYDKSKINFQGLFKKTIDKLMEFKTNKLPLVKPLMVMLHGVMFQHLKRFCEISGSKSTNSLIVPDANGEDMIIYEDSRCKYDKQPQYKHSRNAIFYYSYLRYILHKSLSELHKNKITVNRIYKDSITCDKNDLLTMDNKIGHFKFEMKNWNGKNGIFENVRKWRSNDGIVVDEKE